MQQSGVPSKFPIPFASSAGPGFTRPIPKASQIGINPGYASLTDGFPPLNFTPESSGGIPPFGQDVNGLQNQVTSWIQWLSAGAPVQWDATFSTDIGGYPKGAIVASATTFGLYWYCLADNNTTNPDTGGANWKAFALTGGSVNYYADSGPPNAMVITPQPPIAAYADGQTFVVNPSHANTTATTLAVSGLAAVPVVNPDGSALQAAEIVTGSLMLLTYKGGSFQWLNPPWAITRSPADNSHFLATTAYADQAAAIALAAVDTYAGALYGLILSNTPAAPTTSITISVGACRDSSNTYRINSLSPMAKLLTSTWVAGNNNGGRLSGTLANGQTWYLFALLNPTTLAVDFAYDQSPTAPDMTLPTAAGFTKFRRLGAVLLDVSATTIRAFTQIGDWFMLKTRSSDYAATANGAGVPYYRVMTVPIGIVVEALMVIQTTGTVDANPYYSGVFNPAFGAPPAFGGVTQWAQIRRLTAYYYPGVWGNYGYTLFTQFTDTTGHVYTFSSDPSDILALGVLGWRDERGKFFP